MNKFKNKKIFTTAGKFDSKKEMHRYLELAAMQEAGKITGLERQARYILIGSQKREDGTTERPVSYTADFRYTDKEGTQGTKNDVTINVTVNGADNPEEWGRRMASELRRQVKMA